MYDNLTEDQRIAIDILKDKFWEHYISLKDKLQLENEIFLRKFSLKNNSIKPGKTIFEEIIALYEKTMFFPDKIAFNAFNQIGIKEDFYKKYFLDINELDILIKDIFSKEAVFTPYSLLLSIQTYYRCEFIIAFTLEYSQPTGFLYNKRPNANEIYVKFINLFRRMQKNSINGPKIYDGYEQAVFDVLSNNRLENIFRNKKHLKKFLSDLFIFKSNNTFLLKEFFKYTIEVNEDMGITEANGVSNSKIKYLFAPIFFKIFQNDYYLGLCDEYTFNKLPLKTQEGFDFSYKKYYLGKLKNLIGI